MRTIFFLILLFACLGTSAQNEKFSRVKIHCNRSELPSLFSLGIPEEGILKKDDSFITELSAGDIAKVAAAGFQLEVLIDDVQFFYTDRNLHPGKYKAPVPKQVNCDGTGSIVTPSHYTAGTMGGFYKYNEMLAQLDSMRVHYPNLVTVRQQISTLQTIQGRPVYFVKISDNPDVNENEPEIFYSALTHAREPMGMQALIFYMWHLLESYGTDPEITALINNLEIYFVPCVNVDGYIYNETTNPSGGGMWRKNRRNNGDGTYGIDLNRNYGYMWGYDNTGSSPVTGDETYRGTAAFSEPEPQIMKWFAEHHSFRTSIDYHCFGNYLLYPWSYAAGLHTQDSVYYTACSQLMAATNDYLVGTPSETLNYTANGASFDWFYGEQSTKNKIIAWSPEAGDAGDGFWPASNRIEDIARVNTEQNLYVARFATKYAYVEDLNDKILSQLSGHFVFSIQRLGLDTATFTVSLIPLSLNITSTGANKVFTNLNLTETRTDSIAFTLSTGINQGSEVTFVLRVNSGLYIKDDTIRKVFGTPVILFSDNCGNTTNWTAGNWALTTGQYHSPPSSITDSPFGDYSDYENSSIVLSGTVSLIGVAYAQLSYWAKWDIEEGYDYVQAKISVNGGTTWTPLCGKYTHPGTMYQMYGEPLYDGTQSAWVKEEIDLADYIGSTVKICFTLVSDGGMTYDGFYFDDAEVRVIYPTFTGISENENDQKKLFPNPCNDVLNFHLPGVGGSSSDIQVMNIFGETLGRFTLTPGKNIASIDVSGWPDGVYFVFCRDEDSNISMKKFIVVH